MNIKKRWTGECWSHWRHTRTRSACGDARQGAYTRMHTRACVHALHACTPCTGVYMHTRMSTCMHTCMCLHMPSIGRHACSHAYTCASVCQHAHICTHTDAYAGAHEVRPQCCHLRCAIPRRRCRLPPPVDRRLCQGLRHLWPASGRSPSLPIFGHRSIRPGLLFSPSMYPMVGGGS